MPDTTATQLRKFGAAVRAMRLEAGLSQEKFAEASDLHFTYVSKIERAAVNVSFEVIAKMARGLKCKPSAIYLRAKI